MNKLVSYLTRYLAEKDLSCYPGVVKKSTSRRLDFEIAQASFVLHDTAEEPCAIDWRRI